MAILWSRFFRGTLQFWMSLQLLQLGWGRQSWLGTGDHFWGDSRTPFAVANKGANSHTDTLLNIPKKSSRYVKLNCLLDSFLGFFSGETKAEIYDTQDRKIQVCIKYIFLYVHNIILVVLSSQHLGRGKFHSENPSEKKKTKAIQGFGVQGLALAGGCKVTTKIGSKEDLITERGCTGTPPWKGSRFRNPPCIMFIVIFPTTHPPFGGCAIHFHDGVIFGGS